MSMLTVFPAACAVIVLAVPFGICSYHLSSKIVNDNSEVHQHNYVYCDADGEAAGTEQQKGERVKAWVILIFAFGALAASIPNVVLLGFDTAHVSVLVGWSAIVIDALLLCRESLQTRRFNIGVLVAASSLLLCLALFLTEYSHHHSSKYVDVRFHQLLVWLQAAIAVCLSAMSSSLCRRPVVFFEEKEVDQQFTCSAIQRYSTSWIGPLLYQARKVRSIDYDDLPVMDHNTRSRELEHRILSHYDPSSNTPLWRAIARDHAGPFFRQWYISVIESVVMMLPAYCLFRILSELEQGSFNNAVTSRNLWFWTLCLGAAKVLHVVLDNWLYWVSFAIVATPIRSQLSALIFSKSLRMKANEAVQEHKPVEQSSASSSVKDPEIEQDDYDERDPLISSEVPLVTENDGADTDDGKTVKTGFSKGVVNLLSVDVQRIYIFCGYSVDIIRGIVKIIVSVALLVSLIGWWSTIAGVLVPVTLQPLVRYASSSYSARQQEVMGARDNKAHVVREALHGIRQIKFTASELQWEKRIFAARDHELNIQRQVYNWGILLTFAWISMPVLVGATALSVYAWLSGHMIASVAFTALSVFSNLEYTIGAIPASITELLDAIVSIARIEEHLATDERVDVLQPGEAVELNGLSVTWPSSSTSTSAEGFVLHDLNLRFPGNALSVIYGKTGVGKSLLLNAIIGEADVVAGEIKGPRPHPEQLKNTDALTMETWIIPSAYAYVGQVPWIENATVRDVILFGLPYRHDRYLQVLHACALHDDIKMLPDGHDTEIGATGINLSGGQRWRFTLARALYSRAGVLVLDDIFSAVDSHVGRHLLHEGILGPLGANRTTILVTHHVDLVRRYASYLVQIGNGSTIDVQTKKAEHFPESTIASKAISDDKSGALKHPHLEDREVPAQEARKFVQDESRAQGRVKWIVYKTYIAASGGSSFWVPIFWVFSLGALSTIFRSYWLALWTNSYTVENKAANTLADDLRPEPRHQLAYYLGVYLAISFASVVLVLLKIVIVIVASLRAARRLFRSVTKNVLRAPLRWLDTEPTGRVLNRFVGDFAMIDSRLGGDMTWCINGFFALVTIIAAALFVSAWMFVPITVLSGFSLWLVYLYIDAARDIRRLESNAKSPILELVGSAMSGLAIIRCFDKAEDYRQRMYKAIDRYGQTTYYVALAASWMKFRQGVLGMLFTLCIAFGVAYIPSIDASLAGFALSFALSFSSVAQDTISRYTLTELNMNAAERVLEYMNMEAEPLEGTNATAAWPTKGKIDISELEVGYAKDLPSVLKGISVSIPPCNRIGIVGRTGSGKSSMTLALFRFLEARRGSIEIDGVDISSIKLHDLRSRLAIIPQDPVLFSGTLRDNLDPFGQYSDVTLLEALGRLGLQTTRTASGTSTASSSKIFTQLSWPISRGGLNLSQGEKQLICLARAIITQPKILVLDEATSAVDMETDALIQRSIRDEFRNSTLLVVAHRLSTVADFDKILVLSDGHVAEYDEPKVLAQKKGAFWKMLNDSGEKEKFKHLLG